MARAPAPQPSANGFVVTPSGRIVLVLGSGELDITDAVVESINVHQDTVEVTALGDPVRQFMPGRGRRITLDMYVDDQPESKPKPAAPQAPEKPQERAERRARLELPPEGKRPAGRKLGRRGGR